MPTTASGHQPAPKRIKNPELNDARDNRYNPLWLPLSQLKPSLLTADPHTTWASSVTEDGQVTLGSTHPRQTIGKQQLTDLVT